MKPDKLRFSLLAHFQSFLQERSDACPQTRTVLKRLLKKDCRAEGINQIEDRDVWTVARDLYYGGYFAQRNLPCMPSPKHLQSVLAYAHFLLQAYRDYCESFCEESDVAHCLVSWRPWNI